MNDRRLEEALRHFHPPQGVELWHGGATVLVALRCVSVEVAAWRPLHDTYHTGQIQMLKRLARNR